MARSLFAMLFLVAGITGCGDSPTTPTPATGGWQMVVQAEQGGGVFPLTAIRANTFSEVTLDDFMFVGGAAVYDLKSVTDTVWIGYGVVTALYTEDFHVSPITWRISGNIAPSKADTARVKVGTVQSLYFLVEFDEDGTSGAERSGKHNLAVSGDDFLFTDQVTLGTFGYGLVTVFYVPVSCAQFGARRISSRGFSETQTDGGVSFSWQYDVPATTVTCNPATTVAANRLASERPVKFMDHIRRGLR